MAYGKIKADTLVYDNGGSDVEKTVASLAASAPTNNPTFTGTINGAALTLSGNLQVNGTTTTVASSTMTVTDKNIELATGAANDAAADGGGITLVSGDGNKTITWVDATNNWTFNQSVEIQGPEGGSAFLYLSADEADDNADQYALKVEQDGTGFQVLNKVSGSWEKNIVALGNASVELYHDNSKKIETTSTGVTVTGRCTASTTVFDSKGNVRDIIQNTQSSAYTLTGSDSGKHILISTGGVTVPANAFGAGNAVTIVNNSGSDQTITQDSGITMYNAADASTGNRTLAARGVATVLFASGAAAYISGAGLS